jgi:hypothetical protein
MMAIAWLVTSQREGKNRVAFQRNATKPSNNSFVLSSSDIANLVKEPADWNRYRIGDAIKFVPGAAGCERYPDSIVCDYLQQTTRPMNIEVLRQVVRNRSQNATIPHPSDIVVHLRLGDGLCAEKDPQCQLRNQSTTPDCWHYEQDCFRNSKQKLYAYPKEWYIRVVKELRYTTSARSMQVVSDSSHWTRSRDPRGKNQSHDDLYRQQFSSFMKEHGFHVNFQGKGTPDQDFIYLCYAKVFVKGGGGYSGLVAELVTSNDGIVITPQTTRL